MSSRLLPFVSGTKKRQKKKVRTVKPPNTQKAPASDMESTRVEKNFVTRNASVQLNVVEIEDARDLT